MIQDYDGTSVIDADGEEIGAVEDTYLDDEKRVRFVKIAMGGVGRTRRLVPLDQAEITDAGLRVPYTRRAIEASPDAAASEDTLEGDLLGKVQAYYGQWRGGGAIAAEADEARAAAVPANQRQTQDHVHQEPENSAYEARDLGDVIEIPVIEEELVKRPVVKEVLRIRKKPVLSRQMVEDEVRRTEVEVERESDGSGGSAANAES